MIRISPDSKCGQHFHPSRKSTLATPPNCALRSWRRRKDFDPVQNSGFDSLLHRQKCDPPPCRERKELYWLGKGAPRFGSRYEADRRLHLGKHTRFDEDGSPKFRRSQSSEKKTRGKSQNSRERLETAALKRLRRGFASKTHRRTQKSSST